MPTKLTEQQRAYMFATWTPENTERMFGPEGRCDQPWNKVDLSGPHKGRLNAVKAMARAAHPAAAAARPAAAIAKKAPAKKALKSYPITLCENAAFIAKKPLPKKKTVRMDAAGQYPAGVRLDAAGECPLTGDQDELCSSCGLWVSTCDCEAESGGESDGEAEDEPGVEALGPAKFVGARWAWRPDIEFVPCKPPCAA